MQSPTRIAHNVDTQATESLIDLVTEEVMTCVVMDEDVADHLDVLAKIVAHPVKKCCTMIRRRYASDQEIAESIVMQAFDAIFVVNDADMQAEIFSSLTKQGLDHCSPYKTFIANRGTPLWDRHIGYARKVKLHWFRLSKQTKAREDYLTFNLYRFYEENLLKQEERNVMQEALKQPQAGNLWR